MNYSHYYSPYISSIIGVIQLIIPYYALRLNRVFGTRRVGWLLFASFALLAVLHLLRAFQPAGILVYSGLTLEVLYGCIPLLLLAGMVHVEALFKERVRTEQEAQRLRGELEVQVRDRTADLASANEELRQEIKRRELAEEALSRSEEQYRFLFNENPQPMWVYDLRSFRFLAVNKAALRHYGFTREEFLAMTAKDLCVPEEVQAFVTDATKHASTKQSRSIWHHGRKSGLPIEVEATVLDLMYGGAPARLVLAQDLTERRQFQEQQLQTQKREITAQLAGGVADNFSRLINVIEGYAKVLLQRDADPAMAESLKRIAATAEGAGELTRQLLALVRRHPMHCKPFDLNNHLRNLQRGLDGLLGDQIKLETNLSPEIPPVLADPTLVEQILHQLVVNARDAMPEGGSLTLDTEMIHLDESQARGHEDVKPGDFVALKVSDTGRGMAPEVQAQVFEPFFTTKDTRKATGLGLATVSGLVKQQFGWVECHSKPGIGTEFTVYLPSAPFSAAKAAKRPDSIDTELRMRALENLG